MIVELELTKDKFSEKLGLQLFMSISDLQVLDEQKKLKWLQRNGVPFKWVPVFYKCTDTSVNENHYAVGLCFEES